MEAKNIMFEILYNIVIIASSNVTESFFSNTTYLEGNLRAPSVSFCNKANRNQAELLSQVNINSQENIIAHSEDTNLDVKNKSFVQNSNRNYDEDNLYKNVFNVDCSSTSRCEFQNTMNSYEQEDVLAINPREDEFKKFKKRADKFYKSFKEQIPSENLSNDLVENYMILKSNIWLYNFVSYKIQDLKKEYYEEILSSFLNLRFQYHEKSSTEVESINKIIEEVEKNCDLLIEKANSIILNDHVTHIIVKRWEFGRKLRSIEEFIQKTLRTQFCDKLVNSLDFTEYICEEVNAFIVSYKYIPELLNVKFLVRSKVYLVDDLFSIYVILVGMRISLTSRKSFDPEKVYRIFYHSILQIIHKKLTKIRLVASHKYITNSAFGMLLLGSDLLDPDTRKNLFSHSRLESIKRTEEFLYKSKKTIFKLFLIMNLHLYVKCVEDASCKGISYLKSYEECKVELILKIRNLMRSYFTNYNRIAGNDFFKCSIFIYNYLIYGNEYK